MRLSLTVLLPLATSLACLPALAQQQTPQLSSTAKFIDASGKETGTARLMEVRGGVLIALDLRGIPPGPHGFHIHQTGRCEPPFTSAGGHWGLAGQEHGYTSGKGPHIGDLPNLVAPKDGLVKIEVLAPGVTLGSGPASLMDADGSAFVIHAKADDYRSQPAGDAGDRIACAIIEKPGR